MKQQTIVLTVSKQQIKRDQYGILFFGVADRKKTGRVTLHDWTTWCRSPMPNTRLRSVPLTSTGLVRFDNFLEIYNKHTGDDALPFDLVYCADSNFFVLCGFVKFDNARV